MNERDFALIELDRMRRYIKDARTVDDIDEQFLLNWMDDIQALLERIKGEP